MTLHSIKRQYENESHSIKDHQYPWEKPFMQLDMDQLMQYLLSDPGFAMVGGVPDIYLLRYMYPNILFNLVDRLPAVNSYVISEYDKRTLIDRDLTHSVVCEWENQLEAEFVAQAYHYSSDSKLPRKAAIEKTDFGISRCFLQVIWPLVKDGTICQYLTAAHYVQDLKSVSESNDNYSIQAVSGDGGSRSKTYRSREKGNNVFKSLYRDRNVGIGSALSYQERIRTVFAFTGDFRESRLKYSTLKNHHQYQVAHAVMSVDISEKPMDISALIAFTGMNRSTTYDVLRKMEKSDLVEVYEIAGDKRRKYVRATGTLKSEFLQFLIDIEIALRASDQRLN